MKNFCLKLLFSSLIFFTFLQEVNAQTVLDDYVSQGLKNNLVLQDKSISLEQSLLTLKDAKSHFLPSIEFGANYNLAQGGRIIAFPVGDLLNGVYSSLNTLLDQQRFPQLENIREQFLPNNFYDTRLRISYPILNTDLFYGKMVRQEGVKLEQYELELYKAELTRIIKQAYFSFCMAHTAVKILENSKVLVEQNLKDNKSLLSNGMGLPAQVLRAESEVENIQAQLIDAQNKLQNATYYVNFLLNRPIETLVVFEEQPYPTESMSERVPVEDFENRAEILKIKTAQDIQQIILKSNQKYAIPKINTFLDLGLQGFDFELNNQSQYYLFGLQLSMPVFQGGRNRNQVTRTKLNLKSLDKQKNLMESQIEMAIRSAKNDINASKAAQSSAELKLKSASSYLRLLDKGYKEGINSLIEFIDARNQYTNAALQLSLARYDLLAAYSDLERELTIIQ